MDWKQLMSQHGTAILFVDASPAMTSNQKELARADALAHAARISHKKRRKAHDDRKVALAQRTKARREVPASSSLTLPVTFSTNDLPRDSAVEYDFVPHRTHLKPSAAILAQASPDDSVVQYHSPGDLRSSSKSGCEDDPPKVFTGLHNYPTQRPGWTRPELSDFQFFREVFGTSVRNYSDGGFYNIVVPCFAETISGIRQLTLAFASSYRSSFTFNSSGPAVSNMTMLERFGRAIHHLSTESLSIPMEARQASCLLLAQWYLLRSESQSALTCVRMASKLCRMDRTSLMGHRKVSARNSTDPLRDLNYLRSSFATIVGGAVAKSLLSSAIVAGRESELADTGPSSDRLNIYTDAFRWPIKDAHNLLGAIEPWYHMFHQIQANISYNARIDRQSELARVLSTRLEEISAFLQRVQDKEGWMASAASILNLIRLHYSVGVQCCILMCSEMSFDSCTAEFTEMVDIAEKLLAEESTSYKYSPVYIFNLPLWFVSVHCRHPVVRRRAIASLLQYHRNEWGSDSYTAGCIAAEIMYLEERGRHSPHTIRMIAPQTAEDIPEHDRIVLCGFDNVDGQLYLLYICASEIASAKPPSIQRHPFTFPQDSHGIVESHNQKGGIEHLQVLLLTIQRAMPRDAPSGYRLPIYCDGKEVPVICSKVAATDS
ncbi:hypothetical protein H2200_007525 [Cladophialophora chaetospira]|uniref:Transcription factor domain-containing protein n=1 Tax=Cladophialophora chaetospira TaxID=386627 RepID=A0AA38X7Z0_9EURO|nr:hypothetical protein H2200_007525 [Cladophialophora chaetospira]